MTSYRKSAIAVGSLFIITTFTFAFGDGFIQEIVNKPDFPGSIPANRNKLVSAVLLQLICGLGVVGIAVIMFPVFKHFSEKIAIWYIGIRVIECGIIAISGLHLLSFLELGKNYLKAGISNTGYFQLIGDSLYIFYHATFIVLALVLSFGAMVFYYLLYKSKLIPRFISIWGVVAVLCMVAGLLIDMLGMLPNIIFYIPMGANELFLGLWLIFRGFNPVKILHKSSS